MAIEEILYQRRSIRKYQQVPVEIEKIQKLMTAALLAPSGRGIDPQRFIVVNDSGLLNKLAQAREHGSSFLNGAPLVIVILGDSCLSDTWTEDAAIAATFIQLTAESLGLGSCWVQVRNRSHNESITTEDYVSSLLKIPKNMKVECMIGIGYPAEQKIGKTEKELTYNRVFWNEYGVIQKDLRTDEV
ncbi:nitroreductase family protein [Dehalobacter sp. DCM]|uniref:nitroreductase family protein n=1 Tax=Dehalobacter sp. DCM TaxID=2907827 RepID=UPI00308201BF|nr:nitroreductase family protein [Dehalobacter sp. DCM]